MNYPFGEHWVFEEEILQLENTNQDSCGLFLSHLRDLEAPTREDQEKV